MSENVVLLGPQRLAPTIAYAIQEAGVEGTIAAVTAGWEEREGEDAELAEHLGGRVVNLRVWERAEDVYRRDPELFEATRGRHDQLRRLQGIYRKRLTHALESARELLAEPGEDDPLLDAERESAIELVRTLDEHHLERARAIHAEFEERWRPAEREHVARHRAEIERQIADCAALCIAGGHVAILANRLRLFDVLGGIRADGSKFIFAWSAGAMALSERIVLFHDSPPQGPGNAEVLEHGLGVCRSIVPLPHASRRLRLEDELRVSLFARRFQPAVCVALDEHARVHCEAGRWRANNFETRRLSTSGQVVEIEA